MDILVSIFKILFLVIATFTALIYLLFQLYQKIPTLKFQLATSDFVVYCVVSFLFGFGTNSYFGLLSFLPLFIFKFVCYKTLVVQNLKKSGFWIEVEWKKLSPKGFERNVPKHILNEMNKMVQSTPRDQHFLIPRIYAILALKIMMRKIKKESTKNLSTTGFSAQQQNMGLEQLNALSQALLKLEAGKSEKKDLNIGVLKVTRH